MASPTPVFGLVFLVILSFQVSAKAQPLKPDSDPILPGSSLSPLTQPTAWSSPSKRFAFGFFPEGSGYKVGIWIVGGSKNTTIWTANRDKQAVSSNATLQFIEGHILLKLDQGDDQIITDGLREAAFFASMQDSGNFVLQTKDYVVIWDSFTYPTDTIIGGQTLRARNQLVSSLSSIDHSSGRFRFKMQDDGNLVAYPINTKDEYVDAYWTSNTAQESFNFLNLSLQGQLFLVQGNDSSRSTSRLLGSSSYLKGALYRATMDYDGNFRLYSHRFGTDGKSVIFNEWEAISDICDVKSLCGFNSYCTRIDGKQRCACLPEFNSTDLGQSFGGCERNFTSQRCIDGKEDVSLQNMIQVANITWEDHPYSKVFVQDKEDCNKSCSKDCDCDAAIYGKEFQSESWSCSKYKLPLKYVRNLTGKSVSSVAFVKISNIITSVRNPENNPEKLPLVTILALSLSFVAYSSIALAAFSVFVLKLRIMKYKKQLLQAGATSITRQFTLRTCTYSDLKKATDGFKRELGKGGFGAVYEGTFDKGKSSVAVKKLDKVVEEGEREFRAEMRAIGITRHKNLVRLLGYCIEGSQRFLVYEYMPNGSLADHLYGAHSRPSWQDRVRIALDVARGIPYLHEECETPIIHCDIKPQNILLDQFWTPKISDFGLAKFLMPDQTRTLTGKRGTPRYMAPEWERNIPISVKVDVYSFGIVLLEIICCRRNLEVNIARPEETQLSSWAYECFASGNLHKLMDGEVVDKKTFERMVMVALWCIQEEPALRFPMKTVTLMLEGTIEAPIPPCPKSNSSSSC